MKNRDASTGSAQQESLSSCMLGRVKAHDPQAWARMVNLFGPIVYRWARRAGLQAADSADVVQEVFQAVALYVADLGEERPGDSFRGWLWTITRNKLSDYFRKQACTPASGDAAIEATETFEPEFAEPDDLDTPSPDVAMVHRVLQAIRADYEDTTWEAFWQMTAMKRSAAEAAESLGISKSAARQAKYRVLKRLREEVSGT